MALHITKVQENTSVAEYFIITSVTLSKFDKTALVIVSGYASKESRELAPKHPITVRKFIVPIQNLDGNLYEQAYKQLLVAKEVGVSIKITSPYFEGAVEV